MHRTDVWRHCRDSHVMSGESINRSLSSYVNSNIASRMNASLAYLRRISPSCDLKYPSIWKRVSKLVGSIAIDRLFDTNNVCTWTFKINTDHRISFSCGRDCTAATTRLIWMLWLSAVGMEQMMIVGRKTRKRILFSHTQRNCVCQSVLVFFCWFLDVSRVDRIRKPSNRERMCRSNDSQMLFLLVLSKRSFIVHQYAHSVVVRAPVRTHVLTYIHIP